MPPCGLCLQGWLTAERERLGDKAVQTVTAVKDCFNSFMSLSPPSRFSLPLSPSPATAPGRHFVQFIGHEHCFQSGFTWDAQPVQRHKGQAYDANKHVE